MSDFTMDDRKPFDRTLEFVLKGLPRDEMRTGHRLPTTRDLSVRLKVSAATVRNVYKHLADQGVLSMGVGSGTYWAKPPAAEKREFVIGLDMSRFPANQDSKSWSYRIYGGMTRAIFERQVPIRLQLANVLNDDRSLVGEGRLAEALHGLDGFVLVPSPDTSRLEGYLAARQMPHVSMNPPQVMATRNFVSPDYYQASYQLGRAFALAGRRRVLALFSPGEDASTSVQLRVAGFAAGLYSVENPPEWRKVILPDGRRETSEKAFRELLRKKRWRPDAVCTAGDEMASGVWDAALVAGISVPEDMSVVGGSGVQANRPGERPLTAMMQPLEQMGEELIGVLERWLLGQQSQQPGIYLPMGFSGGSTTTEAENRLLR